MSGEVRLYVLARELGVDSKDLIDLLQAAGRDVKNHMTRIDGETRQLAEDLISGRVKLPPRTARPVEPPPAAKPSPAAAPAGAIPDPKSRRPTEIPKAKGAAGKDEPPPPPEPEAPIEAPPVEAPVEAPPAAAPAAAKSAPAKDLGPIPSPTSSKPKNLGGAPSTAGKGPRPAREPRPARPRPLVAAPPPAPRARADGPKPVPEVSPQKPVMKLPADALRGDPANLVETLKAAPAEGERTFKEEDRKGRGGGGLAGREERQRRRGQRAAERKQLETADLDTDDEGLPRRSLRHRVKRMMQSGAGAAHSVVLEAPLTVRSFSEAAGIRAIDIVKKLMNLGTMATINSNLTEEQAELVAMEYGLELQFKRARDAETALDEAALVEDDPALLRPRPPIVTFMGHVDHGKTSLMDRIRKTNVVAGEAGGITQHVGAYQVPTETAAGAITFLDTPGHEAFTAMRARGANVTDIVVLVVAADDGVKPQTEEAISHAKAAGVAIVVAMNKVDLPGANIERLQQQLSTHGLIPEAWGGDVPMVPTSASTGQGLDSLLEAINLVAELHDPPLLANPARPAVGMCIEASLSEGRGVQATLLVQNGTLRQGDVLLCGPAYGRVRAMFDDKNQPIREAGPSTPVVVAGLNEVPAAGEKFRVLDDLSQAREIAEQRSKRVRAESQTARQHVSLESLFDTLKTHKTEELAVILKADVRGSLEAIKKELGDLDHEEVKVKLIHEGIGAISESDVLLADASDAIIVGFHVVPDDRAQSMAAEKGVEIRRYDIIYQVSDDIKKALEGMLKPETREVQLGRAVVQEVFNISRVGSVAGCRVVQGNIERSAKMRIIRDGTIIGAYPIETLRRFKDDVREVREGMECGIKLANFDDVKRDDVLEAYRIDEIRRTL